jgi:hypothetical protein
MWSSIVAFATNAQMEVQGAMDGAIYIIACSVACQENRLLGRIPSPGGMRPTDIDKSWPIGSIGSRLRDQICELVELVDFNIQLLYTLNLWS